jgi:hypothetical protein
LNAAATAWKVDCVGISTISEVVVAMAFLFGRVDGEEWAAGDCHVGGSSAKAGPRSRSRGLIHG